MKVVGLEELLKKGVNFEKGLFIQYNPKYELTSLFLGYRCQACGNIPKKCFCKKEKTQKVSWVALGIEGPITKIQNNGLVKAFSIPELAKKIGCDFDKNKIPPVNGFWKEKGAVKFIKGICFKDTETGNEFYLTVDENQKIIAKEI